MNLQSTSRVISSLVVAVLLLSSSGIAQGELWPMPARAQRIVVGARTSVDSYDKYLPLFHVVGLSAGTRGSLGAFLGLVSFGRREDVTAVQFEAETYPVIGPKLYGYADYAYGTSRVFPRHRIGGEVFGVLAPAMEGSAGIRFFQFHDGRSVSLLTGSAAMYSGNLWFSIRPYVTVNLPRNAASVTVSGRWYFGEEEEFVFLRGGFGYTPDERPLPASSGFAGVQVFTLTSQTAGGGTQFMATERLLLLCQIDFTRQEVGFRPGTFVLLSSFAIHARVTL